MGVTMPAAAARYAGMAVFRVPVPDRPVSWDNRKLMLRG
jgi:hypothetical protein